MNKVYCSKCKYYDCIQKICRSPIDNWEAPDAHNNQYCSEKNKLNNCGDFREKLPSQKIIEEKNEQMAKK